MSEVENQVVEEVVEVEVFIHYETKEQRILPKPTKLQQISRDYIGAFMTSEEHYQDLPWYREVRDTVMAKVVAENGGNAENPNNFIKAFPLLRKEFVKKFIPELAPKERTPRKPKTERIDIWNL